MTLRSHRWFAGPGSGRKRFFITPSAMVALRVLNKFEVIVVPVLLVLMLSALLSRRWIGWTPRGLPHAVAVTLVWLAARGSRRIPTFVVTTHRGLPHLAHRR